MHNSLRRKMLLWMVALPVVGKGIAKGAAVDLNSKDASDSEAWRPALHAIRTFNTVQMSYKLKHESFGSTADLLAAFTKEDNSTGAAKKKPCLDVHGTELIPGWTYRLHLSPGKDDYLIVIKSGGKVMACGDPGVIYYGTLASDVPLPESYVPVSKLWPDALNTLNPGWVAEVVRPARANTLLRRVGFINMNVSTAFVECGCTCGSSPQMAC